MFGAREVELTPSTPVALLSLADVKAALGITGAAQDAELTALIATVSASIEGYCGAIFGERTVNERRFLEEGGAAVVLNYAPATALTSVSVEGVAQTIGDYRLNKTNATLRLVDGSPFATGEHLFVYKAGYAAGTMPAAVSAAAMALAKYEYANKDGGTDGIQRESVPDGGDVTYFMDSERMLTANGISLPSRVAFMLAPYKLDFFL